MLQVFSINIYALKDPSASLSFIIPLVSMKFDILLNIFYQPFSVSTSMDDSILVNRVYKGFPMSLTNRVT